VTLPAADWSRLKDVFAAARALSMDQRRAYLADACGANLALRHEVDALLTAAEGAGNFLETPATLPVSRSIGNVAASPAGDTPYPAAA